VFNAMFPWFIYNFGGEFPRVVAHLDDWLLLPRDQTLLNGKEGHMIP